MFKESDYESNKKRIVKFLKRNFKYQKSLPLEEFYFPNKGKISAKLNSIDSNLDAKFPLQLRWETEIGESCRDRVIEFIGSRLEEDRAIKSPENPWEYFSRRAVDFNDFRFHFRDEEYDLKKFSGLFPTSQVGRINDLRGIDLSGINISNAKILNAHFAYANFDKAYIFQVQFENTNFVEASLREAQIVNITLLKGCTIRGADIRGAFVNIIRGLDDGALSTPLRIQKINYFWLIRYFFRSKQSLMPWHGPHTKFLANHTNELTIPENRSTREYINWYQNTLGRISYPERMTPLENIEFVLALFFTKHWDSYLVLLCWSLITVSAFGLGILLLPNGNFSQDILGFFDAFYISAMNFTSLGPGSTVLPVTVASKLLVLIESTLGYLSLGVFVFLIGHKVSRLY
jgi:hypothetical protein